MKQDFYLLEVIDKQIKYLTPSGLIEFWGSQHITIYQTTREVFYPKALSLLQFRGSFYIIMIGWLLSFASFLAETIYRNW
jgi:hypothetical protein